MNCMENLQKLSDDYSDTIKFPKGGGTDYSISRGKYTRMAYCRVNKDWQNAEDAFHNAVLSILENPVDHMPQEDFEKFFTRVLFYSISKSKRSPHQREVSHLENNAYLEAWDETNFDAKSSAITLISDSLFLEREMIMDEVLSEVNEQLLKLSSFRRQIVSMGVLYGYSPKEISIITDCNPKSISKMIQRFKETLKEKNNGHR